MIGFRNFSLLVFQLFKKVNFSEFFGRFILNFLKYFWIQVQFILLMDVRKGGRFIGVLLLAWLVVQVVLMFLFRINLQFVKFSVLMVFEVLFILVGGRVVVIERLLLFSCRFEKVRVKVIGFGKGLSMVQVNCLVFNWMILYWQLLGVWYFMVCFFFVIGMGMVGSGFNLNVGFVLMWF